MTTKPKPKSSPSSPLVRDLPLPISISMIIIALGLSFVDLTFLNDVIGKVLDLDYVPSAITSFALGLVGMVVMASLGVLEYRSRVSTSIKVFHYTLWVLIGLAYAAARLFSAFLLRLDGSSGDAITYLFGAPVREIDFVFAPLMFLLYVATGLLTREGIKNMLLNEDFHNRLDEWKKAGITRKLEKEKRRIEALEARERAAEAAAAAAQEAADKNTETRAAGKIELSERKKKDIYYDAVGRYKQLEVKFHDQYGAITDTIAGVEATDASIVALARSRKNIAKTISITRLAAQKNVAFIIQGKTNESIAELNKTIDKYNADAAHD
jgi:hypothetical protein